MRISSVALVSTVVAVSSAALASPSPGAVSLDKPGKLESIERENPGHFRRITEVLRTASQLPCHGEAFGLAVVAFDAREARCGLLLMTSYPAKRRLSFVLDQTRYVTTVTMNISGWKAVPVDAR